MKEASDSKILQELALAKDASDIESINATKGGADAENRDLIELRKGLARAWLTVGGTLSLPRTPSAPGQGWTSGPASEAVA
jgi:hypothetical protein